METKNIKVFLTLLIKIKTKQKFHDEFCQFLVIKKHIYVKYLP